MLKPIPAAKRPSSTASRRPCHQVWSTKTSSVYDTAKPARRMTVFKYICQQSRGRRPVVRKYSSTRRRSSSWKALPCANFSCCRGWVISTDILVTLQRPRLRRRLAVVRPRELRVACLNRSKITPRHCWLQNRDERSRFGNVASPSYRHAEPAADLPWAPPAGLPETGEEGV